MPRLSFLVTCLAGVFAGCGLAAGQPVQSSPALAPQVDQRVELLSIVFRLAGNPEYNMNTLPAYSAEIDRYFVPYKNHPAVQMAGSLRNTKGVSFDAVMSMAISLSPPPELKPVVPLSAGFPDSRWGVEDANQFLAVLRDFYRDSHFAGFYASQKPMYETAEQRFAATLAGLDLGWYPRFYGEKPGLTYHLLLGMNNGGGNYGPRLTQSDGRMELFSIIGCWTHDDAGNPTYPADKGYLSTIVHEFNHSFVNPAVDQHWKEFSGTDALFSAVSQQMRKMAYGDAHTMMDESLVRAAVIVYFREHGEDSRESLLRIRQEQRNGFLWMDQLVDLMKGYDANRREYPTFASYMPQVVSFYAKLQPKAGAMEAAFDAESAHVVGIEPFANHAQNVDPSLKTITVMLDKPLRAGSYSIVDAQGGAVNPVSGPPVFEAGGRQLALPVQLKPNEAYSFVLSPMAFFTTDGYPLASYKVDFRTGKSREQAIGNRQ